MATQYSTNYLDKTKESKHQEKPKLNLHIPRENVSIIEIIGDLAQSPKKVHFCYQIVERTLASLIKHEYSNFDAHTTSNCCHGMAVLVRELIHLAQEEDLDQIHNKVQEKLQNSEEDPLWLLPKSVVKLSQLYILNHILEITPKGARSSHKKLLNIATVETKFCDKLVKNLQNYYGNLVAMRYENYLAGVSGKIKTCDVHIDLWGKYASNEYLRVDKRGLHYASSMYSMQVVLAHLIHSNAKIAVINDILDSTGQLTKYIRLLQGDGKGGFILIDEDNHQNFKNEPIVVFGGCAKTANPEHVPSQLDDWIHRFPNLVLAQDVSYPQFPKVDEEFHSHPILPEEQILENLIEEHKKATGFSAKDPSLFYLSHIYTSSLQQILDNHSNPTRNSLSFQMLSLVLKD